MEISGSRKSKFTGKDNPQNFDSWILESDLIK